jgi:type I restriction enzyme M protein
MPNNKVDKTEVNISVSTYVEQEDKREAVDISALNAKIEHIVARENVLRHEIASIIAGTEGEAK